MEKLLHYTWQHRLFPLGTLHTADGMTVEVIDPGLPNMNAGPDFFNAKLKLDGTLWVGNVEIHDRASDWFRHGHETDVAYNNVILHVCSVIDGQATTADGKKLPQLQLSVPEQVAANYNCLLAEEKYPPCYSIIGTLNSLTVHSWMDLLTVERLEEKTERIEGYLKQTDGDWERAFFVSVARAMGFGVNSEAFEQWALNLPLTAVGRHRGNAMQVEAFFLGLAGLLDDSVVAAEQRDEYFQQLRNEWDFLQNKFTVTPMSPSAWRLMRLRPQNFPQIRLVQLAQLFVLGKCRLGSVLDAADREALHDIFNTGVTDYWLTHYTFGHPSQPRTKALGGSSIDRIIINAVSPLLFAYGRYWDKEHLCERATALLEQLPAENDNVVRQWRLAGLKVNNAADSQALNRLRRHYCDRKDCLHCRFGRDFLKQGNPPTRL